MKRVVHYINQFYAGIGGEDKADQTPLFKTELVGPGVGLAKELEGKAEIVGTVVCGDGYYGEHTSLPFCISLSPSCRQRSPKLPYLSHQKTLSAYLSI